MKTKLTALLLVLVMVVSMLPIGASATAAPVGEAAVAEIVAATEPIEEVTVPETTAATESTKEATVPETTVATVPTEEATVPETAAATEPTEEVTVPETTAAAEPDQTEATQATTELETTQATETATDPTKEISVPESLLYNHSRSVMSASFSAETTGGGTVDGHSLLYYQGGKSFQFTFDGETYTRKYMNLYMGKTSASGGWVAAYCIEPGVHVDTKEGAYNIVNGKISDFTTPSRLTQQQLDAIGLILLYGETEIATPSDSKEVADAKMAKQAATQAMIWEIAAGYRSTRSPYAVTKVATTSDTGAAKSPFLQYLYKKHPYQPTGVNTVADHLGNNNYWMAGDIWAYEEEISAAIAEHDTIPSFASQVNIPTYTLTPDGTGKYTATLTDTNGILSKFEFVNGNGLTFAVSGNTLTVTADASFSGKKTVTGTKDVPNLDSSDYCMWTVDTDDLQKLMCVNISEDPMPAYFSVKVQTADVQIVKTSPDGKVDGIDFTVKNNTTGETSTVTTKNGGKITVTAAVGDSLTITEKVPTGYISSKVSQTITVKESGNTVTFANTPITGNVELKKLDADSMMLLSGAVFQATDSKGKIHTLKEVSPGVYRAENLPYGKVTVKEISAPAGYVASDATYTVTITENGKTYTIAATGYDGIPNERATVEVEIVKTSPDGNVDGIDFTVKNNTRGTTSTVTTKDGGKITVSAKIGDSLTITEKVPAGYISSKVSQTITVKENGNTVTFSNTPITGNVELKKLDADSMMLLSGAVFQATDSKGKIHTLKEVSPGVYRAENLPYGKVTVKEISAPAGYVASDATYTVTITENGKTYTIAATGYDGIPNERATVEVEIVKTSPDGNVDGIDFTVKNNTRGTTSTVTTKDGGKITVSAKIGDSLTITEQIPKGYVNDKPSQTITVAASGNTVTFANTPITGNVELKKLDADSLELLSGATFEATDSKGKIHTLEEVEPGVYRAEGLPYGKVTIKETKAPAGYVASTETYTVTITENGKTYTVAATGYDGIPNERATVDVEIVKISPDGNVDGIDFTVKNNTRGTTSTVTTKNGGKISVAAQIGDSLTITEQIPEGYVNDNAVQTITVKENGNTVTFANAPITGNVELKKLDADSLELLSGATFVATDAKGVEHTLEEVSTGVYRAEGLPYGKVTIKETQAPAGYVASTETYTVTITENGKTYTVAATGYDGIPNERATVDVEIVKTSPDNNVDGIDFTVKNNTRGTTSTVTTKDGGKITVSAKIGDSLTITEQIPEGYVNDNAVQTITVAASSNTVTFTNKPIRGSIAFNKVDAETGKLLSGAVFELTDSTGTTQIVPEIEPGVYFLDNLPYGKVTVKEISVPEGYVMIDDLYEFEVTEDGKTYTIFTEGYDGVANKPITGSIAFNKVDAETGKLLSGAVFELTDSTGTTQIVPEIEPGVYFLDNLPYGKVTVKEVSVPEGYVMIDDLYELEVTEDGKTYTIFTEGYDGVANKPIRGSIAFNKINSETGKLLSGAVFELTDSTGTTQIVPEVEPGVYFLDNLPYGKVTVKEVSVPEGYVMIDDLYELEVTEDGKTYTIFTEGYDGVANKPIRGSIAFNKINSETGKLLSGAVFEATDSTGTTQIVPEIEPGVYFLDNLPYGKVTVKEISVPEGYVMIDDLYAFEVTEDGKTYTIFTEGYDGVANKPIRGSIAFNKINSETGKLLSGAVFEATDSTGTTQIVPEIEPGVYFLDNLPYGKITVKEISVPEGYVMIDDLYEFEVTEDGKTYTIFTEGYDGVANKPIRGSIAFNKINSETGELLEGAVFELTDSTGTTQIVPEIEPGVYFLDNLPYGKVTVKEISVPEGYVMIDDLYEFEVTEDGKTYTIFTEGYDGVANKPIRGSVAFNKVDAETGELLAGAVFEATDSTGAVYTIPEVTPGSFKLEGLPYGKVVIREVKAPEGYVLADFACTVIIESDGETISFSIDEYEGVPNELIRGSIAFNKINSETGELLSGAVFELTDSTGTTQIVPEVEPGVYFLDNLPYGKVTVKEISVPEGYVMIDDLYEFEVTEDGKTYTIFTEGYDGVANKPIRGNIQFAKTDLSSGILLSGATFQVTDSTGTIHLITEIETGIFYLENLPYGEVQIQEIIAPEGYLLDDTVYTVTITEDGMTYTVTDEGCDSIPNTPIPVTPATGDTTNLLVLICAMLLSLLGLCSMIVTKRKATK